MRIKQIQMKGFKSFGNRTTIRFPEGVSCIVGPNGCGKSNVVDAFLWVMGETAPKHLRGSSMEDLIFAGAGKYPPSGIAEVSLIMELSKAERTQSKVSYGSEIMLTRRLDRDGKSEYFINSRSSRLKDVQEIFMDTGAGVHGFSFIEQGSVESFISSKPEQKRTLIESAAGVSKFRSRKKEAERKLDLTEIHLNRLKDILSQQSTQLAKLRKQSENAEQFRDIKKQIQDKDIEINVWEREQIQKERKSLHARLQEEQRKNADCKEQQEKIRARTQEREKIYQKNKKQLDTLSLSTNSIKTQFVSLEKEIAGLKAFIQVNKQNLYPQSARSYQENRQETLHQMKESQNQIIQLEKKQKDLYEKWEWFKKEYNRVYKNVSSLSEKKQILKTDMMNCRHEEALSKERAQSITEKIKAVNRRAEDGKKLLEQKNQMAQKLKSQKLRLEEALEQKNQMSFNVTNSVQELQKRVDFLKADIQSQEENLGKARMSAEALYSEWNSLKKWASHQSAREKGMQFLLQSSEWKNNFKNTASSIRLPSPVLEKAVSSYMDMRLKSVFCCEEETSVFSALEFLSQKKQGICRFIGFSSCIDSEKIQASSETLRKESGFKFFLKEQAEGNTELIKVLFSNTVVVEDIQTALRLKRKYPSWCFITLAGEVLTQEGDLIGGDFPQAQEEMNILSYQRAMKDLPIQVERKKQQIGALFAQLQKTKTLFHKSSNRLSELSKEGGDFQISILEINKDLESVNRDQDRLISEITDIQREILECQKQVQELQKKRSAILEEQSSLEVSVLQGDLERISKECEKEDREIQTWLKRKDQQWKELAECETALATMKEKNILLRQSYERGEQDEKQALSHSLEKKTLIQKYENQLTEKERKKQVFQQEMEQREEDTKSLMKEQETLREQINADQSFVIQLQETFTKQESAISNLKLQSESLSLKTSTLAERIAEKYQMDLKTLKLVSAEFDREAKEQELQKLNSKLSRMGEVNLLALKEYEELLQENQFYRTQYEDLCISKEKLSQVINRIDSFCSRKFKEVFDEVNSCFSKVWPALFEGGRAELVLTKDPEKGMDIIVQPPGKKVQNMNLLSGGEKAMTAVAVIFSIFLVKPPPFCILDEVDAPLDDINIVRFNSLLAEMAKVSQIILITHNKHTMKECSHLYGVTMEEKGISKVISLNMKSIEQTASV